MLNTTNMLVSIEKHLTMLYSYPQQVSWKRMICEMTIDLILGIFFEIITNLK